MHDRISTTPIHNSIAISRPSLPILPFRYLEIVEIYSVLFPILLSFHMTWLKKHAHLPCNKGKASKACFSAPEGEKRRRRKRGCFKFLHFCLFLETTQNNARLSSFLPEMQETTIIKACFELGNYWSN